MTRDRKWARRKRMEKNKGKVNRPICSGNPGDCKPASSFPSVEPFFFSCLLAEIGPLRKAI
jgi:hypothetical protein